MGRTWPDARLALVARRWEERQKARAERDAAENGTADVEGGAGASAGGAGNADLAVAEAYAAEVRPLVGRRGVCAGASSAPRRAALPLWGSRCALPRGCWCCWLQVLTLDQLVTYLRKLLPADDKAVAQQEQKQVEVPKGEHPHARRPVARSPRRRRCSPLADRLRRSQRRLGAPPPALGCAGMKLLKKNDDEGFMAVSKKKPQQGKGKGGAAAAAASSSAPAAAAPEPAVRSKKLNHSLETLKTFMQFTIEVPQTTAELPTTIEKVRVGCSCLSLSGRARCARVK